MGLIIAITFSTGWLTWCRKTSLSLAKSAVRFFLFGTNCGRHFRLRLRTRRNSNPRNPKLPPFLKSMVRLLSSLISTRRFASSSRRRLSTPLISQSFRGWESIHITLSSANRAYCPGVYFPRRVVFRLLQPLVHLLEVEITEERGNHSALRHPFLPRRLQDQVEESHHLRILHPSGHLLQQEIMLDIVEVGSQVKIDDARLLFPDRLIHAKYRFMSRPLRSVAVRPRLEVCLED